MSICSNSSQFLLSKVESEIKKKPDTSEALRKATQLISQMKLEEISSGEDSDPFEYTDETFSVLEISRNSKGKQGKISYVTEVFTDEFREVILETRKTQKVGGENIIHI